MIISIIITTKNEEKNIENCLKSIVESGIEIEKYRDIEDRNLEKKSKTLNLYNSIPLEIIVVDNNSTDKTKEIARKYTPKVYNFGPERSAQRNFGIKKAKGKYVMFLDADMILAPTVIREAINKFQISNSKCQINSKFQIPNKCLVGLYIPEIVLGNSFWSRVRRFERSFYDGTVIDCVRIVRKDIFEKVGGFDTSLTGPEDWDFDKKVRNLGKVAVLADYDFEKINKKLEKFRNLEIKKLRKITKHPVIFHNEAEFNLKKYLAKKAYYSQSFAFYIQKWGKDDPDVKKQFGFWYRYFGVFLEKGKWKRLIRHPILAAGMWFLRGLVGASYIFSKIKK